VIIKNVQNMPFWLDVSEDGYDDMDERKDSIQKLDGLNWREKREP
jgi:hypothetical protein